MLRKGEMSSWVVRGCVGSESSRESHLMPKRLQSQAMVTMAYYTTHNQYCLCRKDLIFFSKTENDHSGLQTLTTA